MDKNLVITFILIFVIFVILMCLVIKNKEKFSDKKPIFSPTILKVSKKKTDAILEWYNKDKRITEFIILYTSVIPENSGVWVQRKIKCDKKKCRLIIRELFGKRYKLTVLSVLNEEISDIDEIVDFSDEKEYNNIVYLEAPSGSADGTDDVTITNIGKNNNKSKLVAPSPSNSDNINNIITNNSKINDKEKKKEKPSISCDPIVTRKNIKTKADLASAETDYVCEDDREIGALETYIEKGPFYHKTWEKIFE